ncbi:MAG: hypothetical protein M1819_007201 [Sarea resinae]|nr:MAG: hypothetical protein M1819_007201 [Sarea resinae]
MDLQSPQGTAHSPLLLLQQQQQKQQQQPHGTERDLLSEITSLEQRLRNANEELRQLTSRTTSSAIDEVPLGQSQRLPPPQSPAPAPAPAARIPSQSPHHHHLLLLSDSGLPLGSFAFSSGLESYLAHHPKPPLTSLPTVPSTRSGPSTTTTAPTTTAPPPPHLPETLRTFLPHSLSSQASLSLPFVLAAYHDPDTLAALDDELDAQTLCPVARRASVAQGRALLSLWDRAFKSATYVSASSTSSTSASPSPSSSPSTPNPAARTALESYKALLHRRPTTTTDTTDINEPPTTHAHFAPLFGALAAALGLSSHETAYVFLLNHVKAVLSAAVRASLIGPYVAQSVLAGQWCRDVLARLCGVGKGDCGGDGGDSSAAVNDGRQTVGEGAGRRENEQPFQCVPILDLWVGRHELLYSRIFNS